MSATNSIHIIGRLIQDPEIRFTQGGHQVASGLLSVNRGDGKKNEKGYPESDVFKFQVWGKRAEQLNELCRKDTVLAVVGTLEARKVDDGKGYWVNVANAEWQFVGPKRQEASDADEIAF